MSWSYICLFIEPNFKLLDPEWVGLKSACLSILTLNSLALTDLTLNLLILHEILTFYKFLNVS